MKAGVHLPVMGFDGQPVTREQVISNSQLAESLGYDSLSVNDHVVFSTGWLDAISVLSAAAACTTRILVGTSILNIVVRNPVVSAKALAAIDILSSGRLFAGVGPGSSPGDYEACGLSFEERWPRFSEALEILVELLDMSQTKSLDYKGSYYHLEHISLFPKPVQRPHPPIFIGSWGSEAGLRRVAKYGDGWMASAYNITPAKFKEKYEFLISYRKSLGIETPIDNCVMSMFGYIDDDSEKVRKMVKETLSPALGRPAEDLERMLLFGSLDQCVHKLQELVDAGVNRVHFWPVRDYEDQIHIFRKEIMPSLA